MQVGERIRQLVGIARRVRWTRLAVEILIVWGVLFVYQIGRYLARPDPWDAYQNALRLIEIEAATGLLFELTIQQWAMGSDWVIQGLNAYYSYMHFTPTMLFLLWAYLARPFHYVLVRNMLLLSTVLGFFVHWLLPTAPPRLVFESGMVDTLDWYGSGMSYSSSGMAKWANQFAAVPSFHFGWALFIAVAFVVLSRYRWRYVVLVHPTLILVAIMATGNHFILDAVAAIILEGLVVIGLLAWERRRGTRPEAPDETATATESVGADTAA